MFTTRQPSYVSDLDMSPEGNEQRYLAMIQDNHTIQTRRKYKAACELWESWCRRRSRTHLPASDEDLLVFMAERIDEYGDSYCKLRGILTALNSLHVSNGYSRSNSIRVLSLLRARRKQSPIVRMRPVSPKDVKAMCDLARAIRRPVRAARDSAIMLLLYTTAERNAEFCRMQRNDINFVTRDRIVISIPYSKGDQLGQGQRVAIRAAANPQYCPIAALQTWLKIANISAGMVFRSIDKYDYLKAGSIDSSSLYRIIREYATYLNLGPKRGPHSFRRGFATHARDLGVGVYEIKTQLRHALVETTETYIDDVPVNWDYNPTRRILS